MSRIVTATLVVQVTAKLNGERGEVLKSHLHDVVDYASNHGLITGETAMEVQDMDWDVILGEEYDAAKS